MVRRFIYSVMPPSQILVLQQKKNTFVICVFYYPPPAIHHVSLQQSITDVYNSESLNWNCIFPTLILQLILTFYKLSWMDAINVTAVHMCMCHTVLSPVYHNQVVPNLKTYDLDLVTVLQVHVMVINIPLHLRNHDGFCHCRASDTCSALLLTGVAITLYVGKTCMHSLTHCWGGYLKVLSAAKWSFVSRCWRLWFDFGLECIYKIRGY